MSLRVYYEVLNQRGTPALFTDTLANRPAFGFQGRLFFSTDTGQIFEDTGTAWTVIADAGAGTTGTLQQVTTNGNTTTLGITVQGIDINDGAGTGANNMAIGSSALANNTTGISNTAVGFVALGNNTTGGGNVGVGFNALQFNTTGGNNTALGFQSLKTNTIGVANTAIGFASLQSNTTGDENTSIGNQALFSNTTGFINTAIGSNALNANTTGTYNAALGVSSLLRNTTGSNNTAVGWSSGSTNTTGSNNIFIGQASGGGITTGSFNTIIGTFTGTAGLSSNIVLADGQGNVRYQFDGTNNVFGANVIAPQVRASTSAGLSINANSGTQVADFGAGGSANLTLYGGLSGTSASFSSSVTGNTIVKSGGTAAQILAADGSVITAGTNITISGGTISSSGGGSISLAAIGSTPNANAATLTGSVLNLQPASASFGGVVTTGTQTFAGEKTFNSTTANVMILRGTSGGASNNTQLRFYGSASAAELWAIGSEVATGTSGSAFDFYSIAGGANRLRIDGSGNIGVNTTTIGSKLQVNGNAAIGYSASTAAPTNGLSVAGTTNIGTNTSVTTALLQVSSTTQGFLPPVMTTTQKNAISSPATGLVVFDSTLGKLCVFSTTWETITSV
jgi:hypothetical protein